MSEKNHFPFMQIHAFDLCKIISKSLMISNYRCLLSQSIISTNHNTSLRVPTAIRGGRF